MILVPSACAQAHREPCGHDHADGDGQDPDAGLEGGVAEHGLHVGGQEEQDAHQGEEDERDREARGAEARVAEHAARRASGARVRRSQAMKAASDGHAERERGEDHGRRPSRARAPRSRPRRSRDRPAIDRPAPGRSSLGCLGIARLRDEAPRRRPGRAATIGRLTRNKLFQLKCSSSQPPVIGPTAMPTPDTAAHAAIALGRSCAREDVGQDRQRRRHDPGGAEAHQRP